MPSKLVVCGTADEVQRAALLAHAFRQKIPHRDVVLRTHIDLPILVGVSGAVMVADVSPFGSSNPRWLTNVGGILYFTATDPAIGAVRLALAEAQGAAFIPTYKTRDHLAL